MKGKHPTSNIQHRTPNGGVGERLSAIGCWLFDVRCWMFFPHLAFPLPRRVPINDSATSSTTPAATGQ